MITKTQAFQTTDGNTYATLEIAQRAEILKLLTTVPEAVSDAQLQFINRMLDTLFSHLDDVKEILRCTGRKARKSKGNGATRKRKTATEVAK